MCFKVLYCIYLGRLGRWLHTRQITSTLLTPHLKWRQQDDVPTFKIGSYHVLPVPYLYDNLGYIVFSQKFDGSFQLEFLVDPGDFEMFM
jgi:hypothetical protein